MKNFPNEFGSYLINNASWEVEGTLLLEEGSCKCKVHFIHITFWISVCLGFWQHLPLCASQLGRVTGGNILQMEIRFLFILGPLFQEFPHPRALPYINYNQVTKPCTWSAFLTPPYPFCNLRCHPFCVGYSLRVGHSLNKRPRMKW